MTDDRPPRSIISTRTKTTADGVEVHITSAGGLRAWLGPYPFPDHSRLPVIDVPQRAIDSLSGALDMAAQRWHAIARTAEPDESNIGRFLPDGTPEALAGEARVFAEKLFKDDPSRFLLDEIYGWLKPRSMNDCGPRYVVLAHFMKALSDAASEPAGRET